MDQNALRLSVERFSREIFSRSGGTGGQNVNKVNSRVQLFMPFARLEGLNETELIAARKKLSPRINSAGEIFVAVSDERTQEQNRQIAADRLIALIIKASQILPKRKKTKPSAASREKRLAGKKLRSLLKSQRRASFLSD